MEYYINPWFFYLIDIIETINFVLVVGGVCCLVASFYGYVEIENIECDSGEFSRKMLKLLCVIGLVFLTISIFTPSKQTLIQMLVASKVKSPIGNTEYTKVYDDIMTTTLIIMKESNKR